MNSFVHTAPDVGEKALVRPGRGSGGASVCACEIVAVGRLFVAGVFFYIFFGDV